MTRPSTVATLAVVGAGGSLGALARYALRERIGGRRGTLAVNVLGSFLLGALAGLPGDSPGALLVGVGFCGAFTTFSSFAVETVDLGESRGGRVAAGNALAHLVGALVAVGLGSAVAALW